MNNILGQLQQNLTNLKHVEDRQADQDTALEKIETRFQQIEGSLQGHGAILKTLPETQAQQGTLLTNLNTKIDSLTHLTSKLTGEPIPIPEGQQQTAQPSTPPNPSHGDPEGMKP